MLQAWIDNELGDAERVILQQHVAECKCCSALLTSYQCVAASLFEAFHDFRLRKSLRTPVLDHLPEMNPLPITVRERTHVGIIRNRWYARYVPALAVALVIALGGLVYVASRQAAPLDFTPVGMITQLAGEIKTLGHPHDIQKDGAIKDRVICGQLIETKPVSHALFTLRGPTHVKMHENTCVRVANDRELRVETGRVWFDVAKSARNFIVETPAGTLTVHGTIFDVAVSPERTIVTVKTGEVEVSNGLKTVNLLADEQAVMSRETELIVASKVDADQITAWADAIQPDSLAYQVFARDIQMQPLEELPAEQVFVVNTMSSGRSRNISSFFFNWEKDQTAQGHCSYQVHIYNDAMQELFKFQIDGTVFDNVQSSYEIKVPNNPISGVSVIHIRLIPDFSTGNREISFTKVAALGY